MKSPKIADGTREMSKTATAWLSGANSVRNRWTLPDAQYVWAVNAVNRGGIPQTRPGYICRLTLPSGILQGHRFFRATKDLSEPVNYLVAAVSGSVYAVPFPLVQPDNWDDFRIPNIQFSPTAENVYWEVAQKSVSAQQSGELQIVPTYSVLMMQDGVSAAAYWDGEDSGHTDQASPAFQTPTGTWMAFSGNRLWVSVGNRLIPSDLGDPLSFQETYVGDTRGTIEIFQNITGIANAIGLNRESVLYVFTEDNTYAIQSGVIDRSTWASTPNFKILLFPNIGCVAGRSLVNHVGLLWWYSYGGLVSSDSAAAAYLSSQVKYRDIEMARSKRNFAPDISNICGASFESYLLMSVPSGDFYNAHTMALDYSVADELNQDLAAPAWQGVWTGIRPVEWASGTVDGEHRIFAASVDYAAIPGETSFNHIWEAFQPNRMDSYVVKDVNNSLTQVNNRIYGEFETKLLGDTMDFKKFGYGEIDLIELADNVDLVISFAGSRGSYQEILRKSINAQIDATGTSNQTVLDIHNSVGNFMPQGRRVSTEMANTPDFCANVESNYSNLIDKAFSFRFQWCGRLGIECLRMFMYAFPERPIGKCEVDETDINILTYGGTSIQIARSSDDDQSNTEPFNPLENSAFESKLAFISPITPRYKEVFYSSIPVDWQDLPDGCTTCLPCSRETFTPPTQNPIVVDGRTII